MAKINNDVANSKKELKKMITDKNLKTSTLYWLEHKLQTEKEHVEIKKILISDCEKRNDTVVSRLKEFASLYDITKNEKNKLVLYLTIAK